VSFHIRPVTEGEEVAWIELRHALYGDERAVHVAEVRSFLDGSFRWPWGALVAVEEGRWIGLAELSIRPCAEGCSTSEVAYLEGWYVRPAARGRGVGRALLGAAEAWGRARGCAEFASDTLLENGDGLQAHLACGFQEVARTICFRKVLDSGPDSCESSLAR